MRCLSITIIKVTSRQYITSRMQAKLFLQSYRYILICSLPNSDPVGPEYLMTIANVHRDASVTYCYLISIKMACVGILHLLAEVYSVRINICSKLFKNITNII